LALHIFLVLSVVCGWGEGFQQQSVSNDKKTQAAQFRVIRSVTGSKGEPHENDLTITDPRTVFQVPQDKQVIAYFEWEGPAGLHHFQGTWRGPDGKAFSVSDFQYVAQEIHFRGYWTLTLPERVVPGLWALEATIDGQPAGVQAFQIKVDESLLPQPAPTASDIYQRVGAASVFIDSLDADGEVINRGSGFFAAAGVVMTAFQVIDGASAIRVQLPDGTSINVSQVSGFNRWEDWALLRIDAPRIQSLELEKTDTYRIGDICIFLNVTQQGNRTLENVEITGEETIPRSGKRVNISSYGSLRTVGSPLVNSQGRVVGVVGGQLIPGENARIQTSVLPIAHLTDTLAPGSQVTLAELKSGRQFIPPLAHSSLVLRGELCKDFKQIRGTIVPGELSSEFSKQKGSMSLVITWLESSKVKATEEIHFYNVDNQQVAQSATRKLVLIPDSISFSAWNVTITSWPIGIYRVDALADGKVQWRAFFKIID
jgi:hypothetical protein